MRRASVKYEAGVTVPSETRHLSLRKKLLKQIKRVAHSKVDLRAEPPRTPNEQEPPPPSKKPLAPSHEHLWRVCQAVERKRLIGGRVDGYFMEVPKQMVEARLNCTRNEIEFSENDSMEYETEFLPKEHDNFVGEDESDNVIAISVVRRESLTDFRALVRTEQKDENLEIHRDIAPSLRRTLSKQEIIQALKPKVALRRLVKTDSPKVRENLVILEKAQCVRNYKFGVLYCADKQTDESSMFTNADGSAKWHEFLGFLGEKITLKGWQGFPGGLDTQNNTTGEESIYASWKNFQMMFHVSTMLPFDPLDPQKLERKRHIGNDMVVIIFKESSLPYSPVTITSHFIHVVIVIEPVEFEGKTYYRMEVACRNGMPPFGPRILQPVYAQDDYFRSFIYAKLVNAERAAYHAPDFRPKIQRTRSQILKNCADAATQSRTSFASSGGVSRNHHTFCAPEAEPEKKLHWSNFFDKSRSSS